MNQRHAYLVLVPYTAISRKVVRKSARDNPERYCGCFWFHCSSKKFQRMARVAMDLCLRVLKKSNKSRFDSYSLGNSVLIISHITFRFCRVHIFCDKLSRNSCRHWPFDHCHRSRLVALAKRMAAFETRKGSLNLPCAHDSCTVAKAGTLSFPFLP